MDIQSIKLELMQLLLNTQQESVLQRIKGLLEENEVNKEISERIKRSEEDIKNGRTFSLEEAEKRLGL